MASLQHSTEEMGSERAKLQRRKEDRISDLPDSMIQHILSFLPSTKEAIQTSVLSKRWQHQWTRVPVLIFNFSGMSSSQFSDESISRISRFIDTTLILHDCSKIHKFHLEYPYNDNEYYNFTAKIRFATRKHVDHLILRSINQACMLPKFLFNSVSLVELSFYNCTVMPNEKVNWGSLTTLHMCKCNFGDEAIQHILSGCPLLKSLDIFRCVLDFDKLIIGSKSLKKLVLELLDLAFISCIEISCPNLEELSLKDLSMEESEMLNQAIENVLSSSSLLESFEITGFGAFTTLLIASKSLKRLVLSELGGDAIEVSCPKLEKLKILYGLGTDSVKLLNLPTSATCDFHQYMQYGPHCYEYDEKDKSLIRDILQQLHHVKKLKLGIWIMEVLSDLEVEGLVSPMLNIKCLSLNHPYLNRHHSGIACLLRSSPLLEKLVIKVPPNYQITRDLDKCFYLPKLNDFGEKYWNSKEAVFDCLVSHLKTIKIIGFPKTNGRRKLVLKFVEFLLKNAKVLEKLVVVLEDDEIAFQLKVSRELLNLPRCSQNVVIELLSSK